MSVRIIVDSTADLAAGVADRLTVGTHAGPGAVAVAFFRKE